MKHGRRSLSGKRTHMKIKITADSTCDLSAEIAEQYGIQLIPLYVNKGGEYFRDGVDIHAADIYAHVAAGGDLCSTAAVNLDDYTGLFTELRKTYDAVIHFTISASMSSCFQNARIAGAELGNIYVIDSENLSTGIGQLAIEASLMAQQGMDAADIADTLNEMKKHLDVSFVLDTLEYLRKGGRCSALAALGANLLSLKPCIEVRDGAMKVGKKYRGSLEKSVEKYIRERLADVDSLDLRRIFVTHSGLPQEFLDRMKAVVAECAPFAEILQTQAGCTISSHCGPNCIGILFFRK